LPYEHPHQPANCEVIFGAEGLLIAHVGIASA
jgi:hypothetical protein